MPWYKIKSRNTKAWAKELGLSLSSTYTTNIQAPNREEAIKRFKHSTVNRVILSVKRTVNNNEKITI